MAKELILRHGTRSEVENFKGSAGELIYNSDNHVPVIQDGVTIGGNELLLKKNIGNAMEGLVSTNPIVLETEKLNDVKKEGWYVQKRLSNTTTNNNYPISKVCNVSVLKVDDTNIIQTVYPLGEDKTYTRSLINNIWGDWKESVNSTTISGLEAKSLPSTTLSTQTSLQDTDLNTIIDVGYYYQDVDSKVLESKNYPKDNIIGTLIVTRPTTPENKDTAIVTIQKYTDKTGLEQIRTGTNGTWSPWIKTGTTNKTVPVGTVLTMGTTTILNGFLECNGAELNRTTYSDLFNIIGTTYGEGDGSTTFNIPDLRGEFIRGFDNGRGIDTNRVFGSHQEDAIRNITGKVRLFDNIGPDVHEGAFYHAGEIAPKSKLSSVYSVTSNAALSEYLDFDASRVVPTSSENRPKNTAMMYCIKY